MACLFCGKDIGPIRILRDREFCSPKHRKEYKDRLQKVLVRVGEPETVPAGMCTFQDPIRVQAGNQNKAVAEFDFSTSPHRTQFPYSWTLAIPEAGSGVFSHLTLTAHDAASALPARTFPVEALPFFGESAGSGRLTLPAAKLGAVVLRSAEGGLLSEPIALDHTATNTTSSTETSAALPLAMPAGNLALPGFALSVADCEEMTLEAEPEFAEPIADRDFAVTSHFAEAMEPQPSAPAEPAAPTEFAVPPPLCEAWMPSAAAEPVACLVHPTPAAGPIPATPALRLPEGMSAETRAPQPALLGAYGNVQGLEPLAGEAKPAAWLAPQIAMAYAVPSLTSLTIAEPMVAAGSEPWMPVPESEPATCDVRPSVADAPAAFASAPPQMPALALGLVEDVPQTEWMESPEEPELVAAPPMLTSPVLATPALAPPRPAAAWSSPLAPVNSAPAPVARSSNSVTSSRKMKLPALETVAETRVTLPQSEAQPQHPEPLSELFAVDYHCQHGPDAPLPNLYWTSRSIRLNMPRFAVRPIFDRLEEARPQKRSNLFSMADAAALARRKAARHAITAIAASVTVAAALWVGASAGKFGRGVLNRNASEEMAANQTGMGASSAVTESSGRVSGPAPSPLTSPVAWVKTAASKRAAVRLGDSFQEGMAAWGAKGKGWVSGWSHSADGYVRPGQLALYQPTVQFTDYRMEFFGQIENKSMSWVVRGKDPKNYYAMKFNVVEPGLRPIISMVHYPVIEGKPGKKVEMPLSVMVHNDTPYHVAVEVKGSHYVASLEGQEVDEWTDDSLLAGGVGFFSEAGARARIYWMKVSKNDDWFGRLCGYVAGSAGPEEDTAWLVRPEIPVPAPQRPSPAPATAVIWSAEVAATGVGRSKRGRASLQRGIEKWSS
ncbi:MAG: hypothetical protein LAP40_23195 [Acidobacteriia bacterium]|nr:hypothetical protein [Terriglobia bacterium]